MKRATVRMIPIFCWTENLLLLFTDAGGSFDGTLSSSLLLLSSQEEELIVAVDNKIINVEKQQESSISAPSRLYYKSRTSSERNPVIVHKEVILW
jgi:hypothetical protein